eukprot:GHVU01160399.1.p1 GENE.GHVU01160399.1~~GHVU01160399.1.p1  ORF type:complete len:126 (-),score=15.76 GHVU01160399.1:249-626(-)
MLSDVNIKIGCLRHSQHQFTRLSPRKLSCRHSSSSFFTLFAAAAADHPPLFPRIRGCRRSSSLFSPFSRLPPLLLPILCLLSGCHRFSSFFMLFAAAAAHPPFFHRMRRYFFIWSSAAAAAPPLR